MRLFLYVVGICFLFWVSALPDSVGKLVLFFAPAVIFIYAEAQAAASITKRNHYGISVVLSRLADLNDRVARLEGDSE